MEKSEFIASLASEILAFQEKHAGTNAMELIGACAYQLLGVSAEMNGIVTFIPKTVGEEPVGIVLALSLQDQVPTPENLQRMSNFVDAISTITGDWGN